MPEVEIFRTFKISKIRGCRLMPEVLNFIRKQLQKFFTRSYRARFFLGTVKLKQLVPNSQRNSLLNQRKFQNAISTDSESDSDVDSRIA